MTWTPTTYGQTYRLRLGTPYTWAAVSQRLVPFSDNNDKFDASDVPNKGEDAVANLSNISLPAIGGESRSAISEVG